LEHQVGNFEFDRVVDELQKQIIAQEREIFSAKVIEHAHHPTNFGRIEEPDGYGTCQGECGDMMEIYLRLNGVGIEEAKFVTDGCGPSLACGNMLSRMVEGLSLEEASRIRPEDLIVALDGLPEESEHCAALAVSTLREAIASGRAVVESKT